MDSSMTTKEFELEQYIISAENQEKLRRRNAELEADIARLTSALEEKQQEVNNAMELLFAEQRRYDALLADVLALVEAAGKLITTMEDIYIHPEYQAVWMHYNNLTYGGYKGPQWTKEFDQLKQAIAAVESHLQNKINLGIDKPK